MACGIKNFIKIAVFLTTWMSVSSTTMIPKVAFHPEHLYGVIEDQQYPVTFEVTWVEFNETGVQNEEEIVRDYSIAAFSEDLTLLEVVNSSYVGCVQTGQLANYTFFVKGVFLGYTKVKLRFAPAGPDYETVSDSEENSRSFLFHLVVSVIRPPTALIASVTGIFAALVAFNYINMGVQLDLECIKNVLRKPIGPAIGFFCQFLFMPLASYGIGWIFFDDDSLRLGLFTLGCSPGGSMSNFWTLLFHGDVNLSITMTFISTVAALAMMPFWIFTLGSTLFREDEVTIPYTNMAGSLILLTLPIGIGLLIQQYSPRLTELSKKIIKPFTFFCILLGMSFGMVVNRFVFYLFTWQTMVAGLGIAWGGYSFGALVSYLFKLEKAQIVAISIETAFQNAGVAFVLLLLSMPQPDADLSSVPVVAQLVLTGIPMWMLLFYTRLRARMRKRSKDKSNAPKKPEIDTIQKSYFAVDTNPPEENEVVLYDSRWKDVNIN